MTQISRVGSILLRHLRNKLGFLVVILLLRVLSNRKSFSQRNTNKYQQAPTAGFSGNPFIYRLFGHVADFKPWKCKEAGYVSLKFLQERFAWYKSVPQSDSVSVRIVFDNYLFTTNLNMLQAICGKEDSIFRNSDTVRSSFGRLFPESVAMLKGDKWKKARRVLVSALHKLDIENLPQSTIKVLQQGFPSMVDQEVQEINLWDTFSCATFDSFMKFTYGLDFQTMKGNNQKVLNIVKNIATGCCDRMMVNWDFLWYLPFGTTPRLFRLRDELNTFIAQHVAKTVNQYEVNPRKMREKHKKNLLENLTVMMKEYKVKGKQITQDEIRSMLVGAMFGGFDTTTSSLSLICKAFCENPTYQDKIFDEIKNLDLASITRKKLDNLPYLNSFIKEAQRVYAVAPLLVRVPNRDVIIENTLIKKNTNIGLDVEAVNHEPKNWNGMQDLEKFRPERFIEFTPADNVFTPFGFGARKCPGQRIAFVQLQTIVAYLIKHFKISSSSEPICIQCSLGLTVSPSSSVILKKRTGTTA